MSITIKTYDIQITRIASSPNIIFVITQFEHEETTEIQIYLLMSSSKLVYTPRVTGKFI